MRLVVPERWMIRWSCASTGSISGSVAAAVTILSAKVLSLPVAVAVAGRVARGPPRGVVLCDRLLVDAGDRDGLLGVGAVVGADDVAVVAAVADPAAHAPVRLGHRLLGGVGQGDLGLLVPDPLGRRDHGRLDARRVLEVRGVEALVGHDLDRVRRGQLGGAQQLVDVAGGALAVAQRVDHHRGAADDVTAGEDVALHAPVVVGLEQAALVQAVRRPIQVLDLADGEHDRVALDLELGVRGDLRLDVAVLVLCQTRLRQDRAGDHAAVAEDADAGGAGLQPHALLDGLLQVVGFDQQLVPGLEAHDGDLVGAQAQGGAGGVGGGVAAADHQDLLADLHGPAVAGLAQELQPARDAAQVAAFHREAAADVLADGEEGGVVAAEVLPGDVGADAGVAADLDAAEPLDLGDLGVEDLLGQVPVGDAAAQHAARPGLRLQDRHPVAEAAQVVGAAEPAGPGADHGDVLAVERRQRWRDRVVGQRQAVVAEVALDVADADGLVVVLAVTGALAGVVADPTGDRGHRVVFHDGQVAVQEALVLDVVEVLLDLLAGGARVVAGRHLVAVDGPEEAEVLGREQLLAGLLGGCRRDAGEREPQVLGDSGALD